MSKYINFADQGILPGKKTRVWYVMENANEEFLGAIRWFSHWRKYCFYPSAGIIFEEVCLHDIAEFIKAKTCEHKERRNERQGQKRSAIRKA